MQRFLYFALLLGTVECVRVHKSALVLDESVTRPSKAFAPCSVTTFSDKCVQKIATYESSDANLPKEFQFKSGSGEENRPEYYTISAHCRKVEFLDNDYRVFAQSQTVDLETINRQRFLDDDCIPFSSDLTHDLHGLKLWAKSQKSQGGYRRSRTAESYHARFGAKFSLKNTTTNLLDQMCSVYFQERAHPKGTDCTAWVNKEVVVEDGPLVTLQAGKPSNPLVVFIHGWPDSAALWVNQFMRLSARYHCVAVQLPNYLADLPTEELYLDEVVSRIGEVVGDRKAYLAGHDWGANFGYMVAYKFPDRILKYAALDIGNDLQMWTDAQDSYGPKEMFIGFYQKRLAAAYRHPENYTWTTTFFGAAGGSPSGHATARMGMYYDRVWKRDEFCSRLAPDVALGDWKSLWTPLGGTGIPQKGMLYIQGSNLATTEKFLGKVREDGGKAVKLASAGHWLPKDGAAGVNEELEEWLALDQVKLERTPSYASRFGSYFSLANAEQQLKQQMCEVYFTKFGADTPSDCAAWVAEKVSVEDGPVLSARAGNPANPLVVFIHGWPDNAAIWVNQFMSLSSKYYCVAVQLPNYLAALPTEELYLDEVVSRIGEVFGNRKAYLVGHDWGANFGYMVAYKFPQQVVKYAALDIGNDLQMWTDATTSWGPKAQFISYYQNSLADGYKQPDDYKWTLYTFAVTGGSPGGSATARMGMYYDRAWKRDEFCRRMAPDVALKDWKSLWTPLDGTGIPQKGMLYIQGSNLATTDKFLKEVRADGGKTVVLKAGGHWVPKDAAEETNTELAAWLP